MWAISIELYSQKIKLEIKVKQELRQQMRHSFYVIVNLKGHKNDNKCLSFASNGVYTLLL